jgi:hypothetical protein
MEKMFYSIEEAAAKLGKSVEDVKQLAARGQLQEFRDRDKLMFKKEQVDLLAGGEDDMIPLAGDSGELSLSSSGSSMKLDPKDAKEASSFNIFEAEGTDEADANAVTRVTNSPTMQDPGKSGSGGLLDLTKEADDTSLGAGLMEDVYGNDTIAQQTAAEPAMGGGDAGALFETPGTAMEAETAAAPVMAIAEVYDGKGSMLVGACALGMALAAGLTAFILIVGMTSTGGGGLLGSVADMFWIGGAVALLFILIGVIGFFVKKN